MLCGIMVAAPASAWYVTQIVPCGSPGTPCKLCHIWQVASNLINFLAFNLALSIAPLLFVVAGFLYLTSEGNEGKLKKAQSMFINIIVGLAMIFCSWLLVDTVLKTAGGGSFENIVPAWNKFPPC